MSSNDMRQMGYKTASGVYATLATKVKSPDEKKIERLAKAEHSSRRAAMKPGPVTITQYL